MKTVLLTRRRWDLFFGIAAGFYLIAFSIQAYRVHEGRYLIAPLILIPIWLLVRFSHPREGKEVRTIKGYPPTLRTSVWLNTIAFVVFVSTLSVEAYYGGEGWITVGVGAIGVGILLVAAHVVDRERAALENESTDWLEDGRIRLLSTHYKLGHSLFVRVLFIWIVIAAIALFVFLVPVAECENCRGQKYWAIVAGPPGMGKLLPCNWCRGKGNVPIVRIWSEVIGCDRCNGKGEYTAGGTGARVRCKQCYGLGVVRH